MGSHTKRSRRRACSPAASAGIFALRRNSRTISTTKVLLFFIFCRWLTRTLIEPTRALQIKHFIAMFCLSCNSSPARIWVRNIAPSFPVGSLSDGANSRMLITGTPSGCLFLFVRASHDLEPTCAFLYVWICRNCCGARGSYTSPRSARGISVARRYTARFVQTLKLVHYYKPTHRIPVLVKRSRRRACSPAASAGIFGFRRNSRVGNPVGRSKFPYFSSVRVSATITSVHLAL